jgi:hypothetical protein
MASAKAKGAAFGAAALAAVAAYEGGHMYIDQDGGGVVLNYVAKYDELQRQHVGVVVRGSCASSCTMGLGYSNVCLLPSAAMGFHPGYTPIFFGLFGYVLNPAATSVMMAHYPADVKAVLAKHGIDLYKDPGADRDGLRWFPRVTYIKATEFPAHLCAPGAQGVPQPT